MKGQGWGGSSRGHLFEGIVTKLEFQELDEERQRKVGEHIRGLVREPAGLASITGSREKGKQANPGDAEGLCGG